jgi:hypothetical protein
VSGLYAIPEEGKHIPRGIIIKVVKKMACSLLNESSCQKTGWMGLSGIQGADCQDREKWIMGKERLLDNPMNQILIAIQTPPCLQEN